MLSEGRKVTNNFDLSLFIAAGALFVGMVCAKQILPLSVCTAKLSQFFYLPVDLGVFANTFSENTVKTKSIKIFLININLFLY